MDRNCNKTEAKSAQMFLHWPSLFILCIWSTA